MNLSANQEHATVAVIGAGAGGLAASRRLSEQGIDHVVYEAGSHVGGLWVYENDNGYAQAYQSLHINSESSVTSFEGFPFPSDTPLYPRHDQMAKYFADFAEHFDLNKHIRFRSPVTRIERTDSGWLISTENSSELYSHVIVASGHQNIPQMPKLPGDFSGPVVHSQNYRKPDEYKDKRVLIIGVGNSALDIAADICTSTKRTVLSARSPVQILPRMLFGWPTSRALGKVAGLPWPVQRWVRNMITHITHGSMERWGFTTPKSRTHPTSHPTVMHHMTWNRIVGKPGISSISGQQVTFADGSTEEFDVIIAGTGYVNEIPFLSEDLLPLEGRDFQLYHRIVPPTENRMYFLGFFNVSGGANIPILDEQAKWVSSLIAGRVQLPSPHEMRKSIQAETKRLARRYPSSYRYGLELDPKRYVKQLASQQPRARCRTRGTPRP